MKLYFITGNINKFNEAKAILPDIEQINLNLVEIQELDAKEIILKKLEEATKKSPEKRFFCEDTSLYINCLKQLPGPLIKWFLQTLGTQGIYEIVSKYEDKGAVAKTIIGYSDNGKISFFEGEIKGKIVPPSGETKFGWDPIFQPEGYNKTFEQLGTIEKNKISMRKQALIKLKDYINSEEEDKS